MTPTQPTFKTENKIENKFEKTPTRVPLDPRKEAERRRNKNLEPGFAEKLEDLEKHVLAKYGSNAYKNVNDEDDDDWDEMDDERATLKRKNDAKNGRFEGFDPKPKPGEDKKGKEAVTDKKDEKNVKDSKITSKNAPGKVSSRSKGFGGEVS
eukprot:CAMPEP_0119041362 /NCGR_PEP_ID=MMETSP1177-20130426/11586_1 /TAXON_ID=2985 /ORGANISM="Ochromonas sp, Strain CCMP1899" /LENGTH=151 /DNA_ID=CAMNT_0007007345 /DNA_START=282 /DNA_END=734 /DNA_ORIENTATION=+